MRGTHIDAQSSVGQMIERAEARREIDASLLPKRVIDTPFDLFRHELLLTLRPVPSKVIASIVDDIWLPLLRQYGFRETC